MCIHTLLLRDQKKHLLLMSVSKHMNSVLGSISARQRKFQEKFRPEMKGCEKAG